MLGYNNAFTADELFAIEHGEHAFDSNTDAPALYVGTYGKYNDGNLFGMWVDLSTFCDYDDFIAFCRELHKDEEDPEFMFQDYYNFPSAWYSECIDEDDFDKIVAYGELSESDQEMYDAYLDHVDSGATFEDAEDHYVGYFDSERDCAAYIFNECYMDQIPEHLQYYIDFDAYARDLFCDGYSFYDGHVFHD